ncbi:hypothetical protein [Spongiivirga citrea]|uniref:Uncharacterized protein n=1 Tax=Spongiivirga citrea TaxID=1481457 RepID=A0A6M0CS63_9FLAO|nr:hypothetical protein [Spongiivirga citrea]NER18337.1 hypothetical protein [Spongiivirga citrea]
MKHLKFVAIVLLSLVCFSCNDDDELTQEQEAQNLLLMFTEIEGLVASVDCTDASEWTFTDYGSKACGGPSGYIAYPTTIDTALFLEKIAAHKTAQRQFNEKWGVISDCSILPQPSTVSCVDGKPVLE